MILMRLIQIFRDLSLIIVCFLMLIPMQLNIGGLELKTALITLFGLSLMCIFTLIKSINKDVLNVLIYLFLLAVYFCVNSLIYGLQDIDIVKRILTIIIIFLASYQLVKIYRNVYGERYSEKVFNHIILVVLLHSIIMILIFMSEDMKNFIYNYVQVNELAKIHLEKNLRMTGLFYSGFSSLGSLNGIVLIIILAHVYKKTLTLMNTLMAALAILIQLIAISLSGRSGFIVVLFGLFFYIIMSIKNKYKIAMINFIKIIIILAIFTTILIMYVSSHDEYENILHFAFEIIYNYMDSGSVSSKSTTGLFTEMYFLPNSEIDTLVGTSNFGRSDNMPYIDSDSTYILFIFGSGLIGLLVGFSIYFYFLYMTYKMKYADYETIFLLKFMIISYFILSIKDFYYFSFTGHGQIFFILLSLLIFQNNDHKKNMKVIKNVQL
jgi:hypothetical protein